MSMCCSLHSQTLILLHAFLEWVLFAALSRQHKQPNQPTFLILGFLGPLPHSWPAPIKESKHCIKTLPQPIMDQSVKVSSCSSAFQLVWTYERLTIVAFGSNLCPESWCPKSTTRISGFPVDHFFAFRSAVCSERPVHVPPRKPTNGRQTLVSASYVAYLSACKSPKILRIGTGVCCLLQCRRNCNWHKE